MSNEIIVKEVTIEEALKVHDNIIEFAETSGKQYFEERYKDKEHLIIVAYLDGNPVGYTVGYDKCSDSSFYCWMAGVDPKFRRNGVLKSLMEYQENWAKGKGYKKIKIKTRNNRREMLAFLVKHHFDFTEVIIRPNIKDNRICLEKEIM